MLPGNKSPKPINELEWIHWSVGGPVLSLVHNFFVFERIRTKKVRANLTSTVL